MKRILVHGNVACFVELSDGIVQLLCAGERGQIPWVAAVVRVFGVATNCYGVGSLDVLVNWVEVAERVDEYFMRCQHLR